MRKTNWKRLGLGICLIIIGFILVTLGFYWGGEAGALVGGSTALTVATQL